MLLAFLLAAAALPDFDALWDYDQPAQTEQRLRALLPRFRASGDADATAQLLSQIARTQSLQMKFAEAHQLLDEAERMLGPEVQVARVRCLLERGRTHASAKEKDKAEPLFAQALLVAQKAGGADGFAVDALHMLALVNEGSDALKWNEKAMALAETSPDPKAKKWLGALYNNTGWTYHDMGQHQKALETFQRGLAWRLAQKQPKEARIAKYTVARALRSLGRCKDAMKLHQELILESQKAGEEDGYVYEEAGECVLALGAPSKARLLFKKAYQTLSKDEWLVRDEPERLERLRKLSGAQ